MLRYGNEVVKDESMPAPRPAHPILSRLRKAQLNMPADDFENQSVPHYRVFFTDDNPLITKISRVHG